MITDNYFKILPLDSEILGFSVAKILIDDLTNQTLPRYLVDLKQRGVKLAYLENNQNLESYDTDFVCTMNTYLVNLKTSLFTKAAADISEAALKDLSALQTLGYSILLNSRFTKDQRFPRDAGQAIYQSWIYNALYKQEALKVLVYKRKQKIEGFLILKGQYPLGRIDLLAVDEQVQNQGIGYALLLTGQKIFEQLGFLTVQIKTQADNSSACALYQKKLKAKLVNITEIYHFWL